MLKKMCRDFADNELSPNARKFDKEHFVPRETVCFVYLLFLRISVHIRLMLLLILVEENG